MIKPKTSKLQYVMTKGVNDQTLKLQYVMTKGVNDQTSKLQYVMTKGMKQITKHIAAWLFHINRYNPDRMYI